MLARRGQTRAESHVVRHVRNTDIEERQRRPDHVAADDGQLSLEFAAADESCQIARRKRWKPEQACCTPTRRCAALCVKRWQLGQVRRSLPHVPCTRLVTSAIIRGSTSTAMTFLARSKSLTVMFPVPGPISSTCTDREEWGERRSALRSQLHSANRAAWVRLRRGNPPRPQAPDAGHGGPSGLPHRVRGRHSRAVHDALDDEGVLQKVLALALVRDGTRRRD